MKTTFKKLALVTLVTFAFSISQSFAGNNNGLKDENCAEATVKAEKTELINPCRNGITDAQVINYLLAKGYTNVSILYWTTCDAVCDTSNSYNTYVDIQGGSIIGSYDLPN